jgi:hypothetical protein
MKLSVTLNEKNTKLWQTMKKRYGLKFNQSLVALLLSNEAERIRQEGC